jgi:hypothetical protein
MHDGIRKRGRPPGSAALLAAALAAALGACGAIQPARMALPEGFEARSERAEITGLGGGRTGHWQLQAHGGEFRRSADRLAFFDEFYVADRGGTSYTISGPDFPEPWRVSCRLRQTTMSVAIVGFTPKPLAYTCDVAQGAVALPWRLSVWEGREAAQSQALRAERRGEVVVGDTRFTLRSSHALAGTPLTTAAPIGYFIERDGGPFAAIELNGTSPLVFVPRSATPAQRRAVLLAVLALAVLWDPAALH